MRTVVKPRHLLLLAVGLFWGSSALVRSAQPAEAEMVNRPWLDIRTGAFRAFSCGKTQDVCSVLGRLEQFRQAYAMLAGTQAVASLPILVYAFPDDAGLTPFKPLYQGKPKNINGFFISGNDFNCIALNHSQADADSLQTIYHEYTHLLLRRNARMWPLWLKEGMADVYSTFTIATNEVQLGTVSRRRVRLLAEKPLLPLAQLFAVDYQSPYYNEPDKQGVFYAQSWLLAHYLVLGDTPAHRAKFSQFCRALQAGRGAVEAFAGVYGPLPAMEGRLKAYLALGKFEPMRMKLPAQAAGLQAVAVRSLPGAETAFLLGNLLLLERRFDEAGRYYELARQLQPKAHYGYEGLGLLAEARGNTQAALQSLQQAISLGSQSYVASAHLGSLRLLAQKGPNDTLHRLPDATAEAIRQPLQKAVNLLPAYAWAHSRLGLLETIQGTDWDRAERHLQAAVQLQPDHEGFTLLLAQLLAKRQKYAEAREILQGILRLPNSAAKTQAQEFLSHLPPAAPAGNRGKKN